LKKITRLQPWDGSGKRTLRKVYHIPERPYLTLFPSFDIPGSSINE
jgi:hypothetical protein